MENLNIEQFNPKVAELQTLAGKAQAVNITDLVAVKEVRLELKNARVEITKTGKAMRDDANAFSKAVIAKEKELIALIEPEEEKLKEAEAAEKQRVEQEERKVLLPERKERLDSIGDDREALDANLLEMDGAAFEAYYNGRLAAKNEADRAEIARKQAEIEEKEQSLAREAETKEREETARKEGEKKAKQDAKEKEAKRVEDEKKQAEQERIHQEQLDREKAAAEELRIATEAELVAKRERATKYKNFRKKLGWTEETADNFYEKVEGEGTGEKVVLFKKVGEFDLTKL